MLSEFQLKINRRRADLETHRLIVGNIILGCELLDMTRLRPGEVFSMRKTIGNANKQERFAIGLTIVDGRLVPQGRGGGLCHVATTLFNAAVEAGLDVVEKHNHSRDLWGDARTVPLGRDATYVYAVKDLKFANPFKNDVILRTYTDPATEVTFASILAQNERRPEVAVRHAIEDEGDVWSVVTTVHANESDRPKHRWIERYLKADQARSLPSEWFAEEAE